MQVDGRGVLQQFELPPHGFEDMGVAVADANRHNAGEGVEIAASGFIEHVLHGSLNDHDGLRVVRDQGGRKIACAPSA